MTTTLGPSGGNGGIEFTDYTIPSGAKIKEIHVFTGRYVNGLQLVYVDDQGETTLPKIGVANEDGEARLFTLEADEYLVGISGQSGWYIDNLRFHTNKRTSETYGVGMGETEFRFDAPEGSKVVGFFGRADWFIDALGIVTQPLSSKQEEVAPSKKEEEPEKEVAPKEEPKKEEPKKKATPKKEEPKKKTTPKKEEPKKKSSKKDANDLEKVEGIGPKIATILIENGIPDLEALSNTTVDRLKEILAAAGKRYSLANPTTWPEQAALGAKGDWEAMEQLKAELNKGRRTE